MVYTLREFGDLKLIYDKHYIHIISIEDCPAHLLEENGRLPCFSIFWFTTDACINYIDFESYPIRQGFIYLLAPGQIFSLLGKRPKGYFIFFSGDFFEPGDEHLRILFNPFINEAVEINKDMASDLEHLFNMMIREKQAANNYSILHAFVKLILLQLYRISPTYTLFPDTKENRFIKLFDLIEKNYKKQRSTTFYTSQIGLTPKRLNQILKQKLNITLTQILHNLLLHEAKREIIFSNKSIKQIAHDLGFNEQAYFSRFFKKQTGMTPENFRQDR